MKKIILILCLILSAANVFSQQGKTTAAVLELEALEGISKGVTTILSNYLRNQIVTLGDFTIVTRENMEQVLQEQKFQLSGCTSQECMVQIGQLLGVRKIFAGSIGKVGKTYILEIKLIDVETGKIEGAQIEECPKCEEDALILSIRNLAIKVVKPSLLKEVAEIPQVKKPEIIDTSEPLRIKGVGSLYVDSFPEKGKVYLNSILAGETPLSLEEMKVGVYRLKFLAEDFNPFEGYIQVPIGYQEKVYLKVGEKISKRIENPGYAYETKFGIYVGGLDSVGFFPPASISGGLIIHFPYISIFGGAGTDFQNYFLGYKVGVLGNMPFDRLSFQYGFQYTSKENGEERRYGFPLGFESFLKSNLGFYFHLGPDIVYPVYPGGGVGFDCCVGIGINYYFWKK